MSSPIRNEFNQPVGRVLYETRNVAVVEDFQGGVYVEVKGEYLTPGQFKRAVKQFQRAVEKLP